jgi:hypothetical protein
MSDKWVRDTGLVFALLFLIVGWGGNRIFLGLCALILVCVLFVPSALKPLAWVWQKIAEILGSVMNKIFFGLVFFIFIVPVGLLKRIAGGDLRDLVKVPSRESAFVPARGLSAKSFFEKPY